MTSGASELDTVDTPNLRRLSPRFWVARQCQISLFWGPVFIVALVVAFVARVPASPLLPVVVALMAVVAWLVERGRYRSWGYAERDDDLIVIRGLLFRRISVVPYGRMQFIDVTAGPIDRAFGLRDGAAPHRRGGVGCAHPRPRARRRRRAARPACDRGGGQGDRVVMVPPPPMTGAASTMSAAILPEVGETWRRLHPLSPVVRFGRVVIGVLVIAVPSIADSQGRHDPHGFPFSLVAYAVLLALGGISGVISWLVTRWRIAEAALQIETGLIRRQSLRIPLARIQAVDVIAPLAGRFLGLAEVRVVSAGRGAEHGRLAYLTAAQAPIVRARLLALAHGLEAGTPEPPSLPLLHIQNGLLMPALLMRAQVVMPVLIAIVAIAAIAAAPVVGAGALGSAITVLAISALGVARAFNEDFDLHDQRGRGWRPPRPRASAASPRDDSLRPHPGGSGCRATPLARLRLDAPRGGRRPAGRVA